MFASSRSSYRPQCFRSAALAADIATLRWGEEMQECTASRPLAKIFAPLLDRLPGTDGVRKCRNAQPRGLWQDYCPFA
eukprot:1160390-Pelagomonas_calceolata.AAC.4